MNKKELKSVESILDVGMWNMIKIMLNFATYEELGYHDPGLDRRYDAYPPEENVIQNKTTK